MKKCVYEILEGVFNVRCRCWW